MKKIVISALLLALGLFMVTSQVYAVDAVSGASDSNYSAPGEMDAEVISYSGEGIVLDNVFIFNHVNGHRLETDRVAYVLFEYEMMDYVKYQVAYIACTCRSPEVNYYSVAYVELDKNDGSVRTFTFDQDGDKGHYTPGVFGDSYVVDGHIPNKELIEQYLDRNIRGASQSSITSITPMHGEVDAYTGATVTPNNLVRMLHGLFGYHNTKYRSGYGVKTASTGGTASAGSTVVSGSAADILGITVTQDNLDQSLQALFDYIVSSETGIVVEAIEEEVTMDNIDQYSFRPNARYVDLRNFQDMFKAGYIQGFEVVPFFDYLQGRALVRNDGWNYSSADLINPSLLKNIFGKDLNTEIFLMCAGGTRAGYVREALLELGYTNVYNIGGFGNYDGNYKVLGDGEFSLGN